MFCLQVTPDFYVLDHTSTPRVSFSSSEFLDESNFITICPNPDEDDDHKVSKAPADFEFLLSRNLSNALHADELFPFPQTIASKPDQSHEGKAAITKTGETRMRWFLDDDPSPRPPRCTFLWKELLRLKKQHGPSSSSLSSYSLSPSSSLSGERREVVRANNKDESDHHKDGERVKKRDERRRGGGIRIRPVIHVPICSLTSNTSPSPRKGRSER